MKKNDFLAPARDSKARLNSQRVTVENQFSEIIDVLSQLEALSSRLNRAADVLRETQREINGRR